VVGGSHPKGVRCLPKGRVGRTGGVYGKKETQNSKNRERFCHATAKREKRPAFIWKGVNQDRPPSRVDQEMVGLKNRSVETDRSSLGKVESNLVGSEREMMPRKLHREVFLSKTQELGVGG